MGIQEKVVWEGIFKTLENVLQQAENAIQNSRIPAADGRAILQSLSSATTLLANISALFGLSVEAQGPCAAVSA
jgi:hypothetical protein